ncbi:DUF397 domain-containing protein [Streptomyces sp. V4I2]|uniref:DUF397 domain-containing protein n=1 Tax=Streptomyces sp. V4I2 TaxID=3042280 RepID=UPI002788F3DC|nr:DUF397 domain-containing protein [Streptomyces sp. V4I2]MDQ1047851.1 hypothetical protein [Streptomyces sp. V4I2]
MSLQPQWRKSSYSEDSGNACVEIAETGHVIAIRDSKHPELPCASVGRDAWTEFTGALGTGRLRRKP